MLSAHEIDNDDITAFALRLLCPAHGLCGVTGQKKLNIGRSYRNDYRYWMTCGCTRQKDIITHLVRGVLAA